MSRRSRRRAQHRQQREKRKPKQIQKPQPTGVVTPQGTWNNSNYTNYKWGCDHWRDPFKLRDDLTVFVSAYSDEPRFWDDPDTKVKYANVDLGVYLDDTWGRHELTVSAGLNVPWASRRRGKQVVIYPWPDYSIPDNVRRTTDMAEWVLQSVKAGRKVDIGCFGAHGRTGTLLALLLILQGATATEAIKQVRTEHCTLAIESGAQVQMLRQVDTKVNGTVQPIEPEAGSKDWYRNQPVRKPYPYANNPYASGFVPEGVEKASIYLDDDDEEWENDYKELEAKLDAYAAVGGQRGVHTVDDDTKLDCEYPPCTMMEECLDEGICIKHEQWGDWEDAL